MIHAHDNWNSLLNIKHIIVGEVKTSSEQSQSHDIYYCNIVADRYGNYGWWKEKEKENNQNENNKQQQFSCTQYNYCKFLYSRR
jgi:hypothetical protein